MGRPRHIFTSQEIVLVRDAYFKNGESLQDLAVKLGVSYNHLRDAKTRGDFGQDLPRKTGGNRAGSHRLEVNDTPDNIMGIHRSEFEKRRDSIKSQWSDEERNWRIRYNPGVPNTKSGKKRRYPGYGAG